VESLHSLQRGDSKISEIIELEFQVTALAVRVALLARLSGLQTVADQLYLFFGLTEMIRSKDLAIAGLSPI
jgi:hypothetical protein